MRADVAAVAAEAEVRANGGGGGSDGDGATAAVNNATTAERRSNRRGGVPTVGDTRVATAAYEADKRTDELGVEAAVTPAPLPSARRGVEMVPNARRSDGSRTSDEGRAASSAAVKRAANSPNSDTNADVCCARANMKNEAS